MNGTHFASINNQRPKNYWTFNDPTPQYIKVQRIKGVINSNSVSFETKTASPSTFLRSKAYMKLGVNIAKFERNQVNLVITPSNYVDEDKIYKKNGMVLANSSTYAAVQLNSHTIVYKDLRYIQRKLNMSFAGKTINNNYLSTSGSVYEKYNGDYDSIGIPNTADSGRTIAENDAFKDITIGQNVNTFNFTEALSIGPFDHLDNYSSGDIFSGSWNLKQSPLIPYVRELKVSYTFKDIAANSLIYSYGRNNTGADTSVVFLEDVGIVSAELVLVWVRPRDELLLHIPNTVKIQSWQYEHKQSDMIQDADGDNVIENEETSTVDISNIYTYQVPTFLMLYGMVDKDSASYFCTAVNTDTDGAATNQVISANANSVEAGMFPQDGVGITIRSNTLGGNDIIDKNYNSQELYRFTLKNSVTDFPYTENIFKGILTDNTRLSTTPSEFYLLMGELDLNSFNIRKGQLQTANVINYKTTMVAKDGYSIDIDEDPDFRGGDKIYNFHIFYIYDRFYIQLSSNGKVESHYDSRF